jgi:hypothetical protein
MSTHGKPEYAGSIVYRNNQSVTQFGLPKVEPGDTIVFKFAEES